MMLLKCEDRYLTVLYYRWDEVSSTLSRLCGQALGILGKELLNCIALDILYVLLRRVCRGRSQIGSVWNLSYRSCVCRRPCCMTPVTMYVGYVLKYASSTIFCVGATACVNQMHVVNWLPTPKVPISTLTSLSPLIVH